MIVPRSGLQATNQHTMEMQMKWSWQVTLNYPGGEELECDTHMDLTVDDIYTMVRSLMKVEGTIASSAVITLVRQVGSDGTMVTNEVYLDPSTIKAFEAYIKSLRVDSVIAE